MERKRYPKSFKEQLVKEAREVVVLFQLPSGTGLTSRRIPLDSGLQA